MDENIDTIMRSRPSKPPLPTQPTINPTTNNNTPTATTLQPNQYICKSCNNVFIINDHGWKDGSLKLYLVHFICKQCAPKTRCTAGPYTTFQCIEKCPATKRVFKNKRSLKSWKNHYHRYHTYNTQYLHITQQQICDNINCGELATIPNTTCLFHQQQPNVPNTVNTNNIPNNHTPFTMINEHTIIDAD